MRIDVVGRHFQVTDAIREHAEAKAGKLTRFFDGVQQITCIISGEDHHHTGQYAVELVVAVVRHEDFIANDRGEDVYSSIDRAVQKAVRQITDFKDKLRPGHRP